MLNIREQKAVETGAIGKKVQSPASSQLTRRRGICRESNHFLGDVLNI